MGKSLVIIGSRPTDLYGYDTNKDGSPNNEVRAKYAQLRSSISDYIRNNGFTDVYSSLDLGSEQYGAEAAINAKANLHALIPFPNQDAKWPEDKKANYKKILDYATDITPIDDKYDPKTTGRKRMDYLRGVVAQGSEVLMVYDGHENENAIYTLNALKKECSKNGIESPKYLNPKTLEVTEKRPFPDRPRIVSEERINEINERNADKAKAGIYTRQERKDMSDIWNAYLNKLTLRPEHERDLLNRGFTKEQIAEFQYKSLPQTEEEANKLVESLRADGWDLSKAPGFAIAEDGGAFSTQIMKDGYFCPARDTETGLLYGMQIRNCNKEEAKKYGKYTWFSAGKNAVGLSSSQPAAYYKGNMTMNVDGAERPVILITEGVLKCNLAYLGMGRQLGIVGMAGVFGQKGLYSYDEKGEAETLNPDEARHLFKDAIVLECFDADFVKNKNVRGASYRIRNELVDNYGAYATARMTWDDEGKGIDDFVVDCNRAGKDIKYNISNVIMAGSPTEVVQNEWNKPETRHVEIKDVNNSPLRGLKLEIKMNDIYAAGYKIQPKIEEPKSEQQANQLNTQQTAEEPTETPEQHARRKYVEHLNERTGRREPMFNKLLPAVMNNDTKYAHNTGKFLVEMPASSTLDSDMKRRSVELTEYVGDVLGTPESANKPQKLFVSDSVTQGQKKYVAVIFTGFEDENKKVSAALKGTIQDVFYKQQFDIGRTFLVSDTELNSAISRYGTDAAKETMILPDPLKERIAKGESLNESLGVTNNGIDGKDSNSNSYGDFGN